MATTQLSSAPVVRTRGGEYREEGLQAYLEADKAIGIQDQNMSVQAARGCLMLNAKELITSLQSSLSSPLDSNQQNTVNAAYINKGKSNLGSKTASSENINGTYNSTDKRSGMAQMLSGGVWGGLDGGGVGSNLQQFVLIGSFHVLLSDAMGRDGIRFSFRFLYSVCAQYRDGGIQLL